MKQIDIEFPYDEIMNKKSKRNIIKFWDENVSGRCGMLDDSKCSNFSILFYTWGKNK